MPVQPPDTYIPPSPPGGGYLPPGGVTQSGGSSPGGSWFPQIYDWMTSPTVTTPDYNALVSQYTAPYEALAAQQRSLAQEGYGALQSNINQQRGYAQNAYNLTSEGYKESHAEALRGLINSLASRGMLASGDRNYLRGRENRRFTRQGGLLRNQLNQLLSGLAYQLQQAGLAQRSQDLASQGQLAGLRSQAAQYVQGAYQPTVTYPNNPYYGG